MHVNNDFQRNSNISHVFDTVWRNSVISRIDISKKLDLYRSTVSNIIGTLLENNVILEGELGSVTNKGGRKPVFLSVNENYGCIAGIELQPDTFSVSIVNFAGKQILTFTGETKVNETLLSDPESLFEDIVDSIISELVQKTSDLNVPVLGISIGIPGIVNIDKGIIIRSDPFNLHNFDYGKKLGSRYGLPLFMENDAKCCAWLQCADNGEHGGGINQESKPDFLCVLARDYKGNPNMNWPGVYKKGVGVGLSIVMNGRLVDGHNYAAGEYVSHSWRGVKEGQTGLPDAVLSTIGSFDDSYREWIIDLFTTLTVQIPLLEPCSVFLHGQPQNKADLINETIRTSVPQFLRILEKCGARFVIMPEDKNEISRGAALMFFQKLFEIPFIESEDSYSRLDWDFVFDLQKKASSEKLLHSGK
ncbi:MAG: ROK family protein [Treponema sp.]|nr:ROK family protein [Treponema sp.]